MRACRARKPLPCALRSSATPALAGDASVLQHHRDHPQGLGLCLCLSLQWKQLSLVYFVVPSACACSSEVTVTSYSHPPSVSPRGIVTLGQSHRPTFSLACEPGLGLCGFIHAPAQVDTTEKRTSNVVCGFAQSTAQSARGAKWRDLLVQTRAKIASEPGASLAFLFTPIPRQG